MPSKIAILNIEQLKDGVSTNAQWISNTSKVEEGLRSVLKLANEPFELTEISTLDQLNSLMDKAPDNLWIFNTHGEVFPIPPKWEWRDFFRRLATIRSTAGTAGSNACRDPNGVKEAGSPRLKTLVVHSTITPRCSTLDTNAS